jgi:hypothetical protein
MGGSSFVRKLTEANQKLNFEMGLSWYRHIVNCRKITSGPRTRYFSLNPIINQIKYLLNRSQKFKR